MALLASLADGVKLVEIMVSDGLVWYSQIIVGQGAGVNPAPLSNYLGSGGQLIVLLLRWQISAISASSMASTDLETQTAPTMLTIAKHKIKIPV